MTPILPAGIGQLAFALDGTAVPFFALFALVWTVSGLYAAVTTPPADRIRLFAYYVPSALGGITVALAADAISFYLCFALMAIPAWGLITHARTAESRRAGAIYLTLTAVGEALLLAALAIMAVEAGSLELGALAIGIADSPMRDTAVLLVLCSIGLKIGTLPVSGVLPLSYTYTPAGAASALAGASAKVGALAMVRLLPSGVMPDEWSSVVMALGIATAFAAALLGTLTTTPRAVLGYSSASQMGLVLVAAGASLSDPAAAPLALGAIVAFSLHHGLAKSALVIGDDVVSRLTGRARTGALVALALPALALVGAPLTSGFVAKYALKDAVHALGGAVPEAVYALLPWTAVGTAALMLRFFALTRARSHESGPTARMPLLLWGLLLVCTALAAWLWPAEWNVHARESLLSLSSAWTATWPALIALGGSLALRLAPRAARRLSGIVAPGDLLLRAASAVRTVNETLTSDPSARESTHRSPASAGVGGAVRSLESRIVAWTAASAVFVLLVLVLGTLATR